MIHKILNKTCKFYKYFSLLRYGGHEKNVRRNFVTCIYCDKLRLILNRQVNLRVCRGRGGEEGNIKTSTLWEITQTHKCQVRTLHEIYKTYYAWIFFFSFLASLNQIRHRNEKEFSVHKIFPRSIRY